MRLLLSLLMLPLATWAAGNQALLYDCYGSSERFVIEGRVIEAERRSAVTESDSGYTNLWRNLRILKNADREAVTLVIQAAGLETPHKSGKEGYFSLIMTPQQPVSPGWQVVSAQGDRTAGRGRLLIVPKSNTMGVISDIDDTVLISNVPDKSQLLKNTLLKNVKQRQTFPGTAEFYQRLLAQNADPKTAPMFYVSASPHQLAESMTELLAQNNFPQGVLLTKRVNGSGHDPWFDQQQYKISKIEAIFAALPWVKFVLMGDDGERDPEIYRTLQEKHPQHVAAIYIRKVHPDSKRKTYAGQLDLAAASSR